MMHVSIQGLFETHLTVRDLATSIPFYQDTVGLELAFTMPERRVAFFWIGGRGQAMLGVWEVGDTPNGMRLHFAFRSTIEQVLSAPSALKAIGVVPRGFYGEPVEEPVVIGWMPAVSLYFTDPDGHLLEYLAILPQEPRPEAGVIRYSEWQAMQQSRQTQSWIK
jgi:lactoylglutathione lyase